MMKNIFKYFFLVFLVVLLFQQSCKSVKEKKISTWNNRIKEYTPKDTTTIQKNPHSNDSTRTE